MRLSTRLILGLGLVLALPAMALAQDSTVTIKAAADTGRTGGLRLFLDCHASGCDSDYLRTELTWINYVRDRTAAQVYVIVTDLDTGSGGSHITLSFTGQQEFTGVNDEFAYDVPQGATDDDERRLLTHALSVGLAHYAMRTPFGANLDVNFTGSATTAGQQAVHDPWNFWVFRIGLSGSVDGESQSSSRSLDGNFSASRVTADWKIDAGFFGSTDRDRYTLEDSTDLIARSHSYNGNISIVRSVGPHFSLGGDATASSSTRENNQRSLRLAPAAEYDFLPYDQYSRRRLVMTYTLGLTDSRYIDTTIYNKIHERRWDQELSLTYATTQPWGNAHIRLSGSNYLSNFSQNRLSFDAGISVRILKGLEIGASASYSRVRDQLSLVKGDASDAEILLRLRQLATDYEYGTRFSISYTFGSLFNNVVNPRMGNDHFFF